MKDRYLKKIITVLICAVLSALSIALLFFCAPDIDIVPETEGTVMQQDSAFTVGEQFTAVRITDLGRLGKLTKVNYVADKFVQTNEIASDMQTVDLTKPFDFAEKGTLIFVILNLDPYAEDFHEQSDRLSEFKIGDYWYFTLSLPKIFCASNVYQKSKLIARNGDIEDYDFISFNTSYDKKTENFSAQTENTLIDLNFYTRREGITDDFNSAQIITVHYQSTGSAYSGIADCPLIGTESAVKGIAASSQNLLITFAILAAAVFAIFSVLSILKRTKEFVPAIMWIFGIALLLLSRFLIGETTSAPLMWVAFGLATSFLITLGALLAVSENYGKAKIKYVFPALAAVGALLAFIRPFVPFGAASALAVVCTVVKSVCVAALLLFIGLSVFRKSGKSGLLSNVCVVIIAVGVLASLFLPQVYPTYINPVFWLCAVTIVTTFVGVFMIFEETEKANAYLTANLHMEVERQIKDIKAVINERDELLQFVSHDMRKPLLSSVALLDTAIERENNTEKLKTLKIIKQNDERVVSNLSEIGAYAKFNYIAEPSQVTDVKELCALLYKYHALDCNANGIVLKNTVDKRCLSFAKKQGLENVVSNIILNAVEHSNCSTVTLSVKLDKNKVVLCIADDGKGISADIDVFKPYVSENNEESGGIGLYICKNIIESMNGELTYESKSGGTTFYISLLKA